MARTIAIVQARMSSERLPGKMMELLEGAPLIEWVLTRLKLAERLDDIVLATTDNIGDEVLVGVAGKVGVPVFRGSETDVLDRYARAANEYRAHTVVRICADRPLVDPDCVDMAIDHFFSAKPDLAFNHISEANEHWPRGFGAEVLSAELLHWMDVKVVDFGQREHVTQHAWHNRDYFSIAPAPCPTNLDPGFADLRFDVDLLEDLDRLRSLCVGASMTITAGEVLARWRKAQAA